MQLSEVKRGQCSVVELLPRKTKELKEMLLMELFHMSNTPAGVLGSCVVGDVFFGWNIKTTNPQALVIKEPVVLSTRAGVFKPTVLAESQQTTAL